MLEEEEGETIQFAIIDSVLKQRSGAEVKLEYVKSIADGKNRFSCSKPEPPLTIKRRIKLLLKKWILKILK